MNSRIILAVLTIATLSSCSTAYKAQTPDDVYYSPAKPQEEYVRVETQKDRDAYYDEGYSEDRYLRLKVGNRTRWSVYDDYANNWYDYRYGSISYNPYWSTGSYWNNYWSWNRGYNPYCNQVIVVNPKNPVAYNQVRNYTPGTYKSSYNNSNNAIRTKTSPGVYRPTGSYNNSNSNSSTLGNSFKKVFSNSNSSNNNSSSDSRPSRTYTPPANNSSNNNSSNSSSSGSSGSSSGSGGGVSRPSRGG
jgi:uncharacterized membrane protein YgcG